MYVATVFLHWDIAFFMKATPRLWLKSYIQYLEINTELFKDYEEDSASTMTLDQSPYW